MKTNYLKVITLYRQGLSLSEIVNQTGLTPDEVDEIIQAEIKSQQDEVDEILERAKLLNDSKMFIRGLAVKAGEEIFRIVKSGRVEEVVAGGGKNPPQVLSRTIDLKDLKAASEAIEKLNKVLNEEIEQLEEVRTLKVEFVDVCKGENNASS